MSESENELKITEDQLLLLYTLKKQSQAHPNITKADDKSISILEQNIKKRVYFKTLLKNYFEKIKIQYKLTEVSEKLSNKLFDHPEGSKVLKILESLSEQNYVILEGGRIEGIEEILQDTELAEMKELDYLLDSISEDYAKLKEKLSKD